LNARPPAVPDDSHLVYGPRSVEFSVSISGMIGGWKRYTKILSIVSL